MTESQRRTKVRMKSDFVKKSCREEGVKLKNASKRKRERERESIKVRKYQSEVERKYQS